jgi:2Fe-2S ferredoxin
VYVDAVWFARLGPIEEMEQGMLEAVWQRRENSRLSCQIQVSADLAGLEVAVPERQGV